MNKNKFESFLWKRFSHEYHFDYVMRLISEKERKNDCILNVEYYKLKFVFEILSYLKSKKKGVKWLAHRWANNQGYVVEDCHNLLHSIIYNYSNPTLTDMAEICKLCKINSTIKIYS